jgi:hypothetical protein
MTDTLASFLLQGTRISTQNLNPTQQELHVFQKHCLLIIADLQSPFLNASVGVVYTLIGRFQNFHFKS